MHTSVYLPLLLSAMFGVSGPMLCRRLPQALATWLLSAGGLLSAVACTTALALLAFTFVARTPALAAEGRWAGTTLEANDPVAAPTAVLALVVLGVLGARACAVALRRSMAMRAAFRLAATLPTYGGELAVIDAAGSAAYAVPGRPGRIVVTTGLLRQLDPGERRAVLDHERAHLRHHHHLHQTVAALASAANPLLWLLPAQVARTCERWADEDAAASNQRGTVAAALTHAGTGSLALAAPAVVLAGVTDVADRVVALRAPAPRLSFWRVALLTSLLAASTLAVVAAAHDTERLFELAQAAYREGAR